MLHWTVWAEGRSVTEDRVFSGGDHFSHVFSHPEEGKLPPSARDQVRRAGRTRHCWWEVVVNQLWLLTTLQLYYLFWYKVNDGPFAILSKYRRKKKNKHKCVLHIQQQKTKRSKCLFSRRYELTVIHVHINRIMTDQTRPHDTRHEVTPFSHLSGD